LPAVSAKTATSTAESARQTIVNAEPSIAEPQSPTANPQPSIPNQPFDYAQDRQTDVPIVAEADWQYNWPATSYLAVPSPAGKTALIGNDGNVYPLVDIDTARVKQVFHTEAWLRTAAFSPDGTKLLLHNNLYDVATGAKLQTFVTGGDSYIPQAGDISPDGTKALVMQGQNVYYYDIPSSALLQVYTYTSNINEVGFARFSPDGTQFTVGGIRSNGYSNAVWVSSVYTTTPVFFKQTPDVYNVHSAIFDTAGQSLLVAEAGSHLTNGRLRRWNIASGVEEYNYVNMNLYNMHDIDIITATITQTLIAAGGQAGSSSVKTVDYNTGGVMMSENAYNKAESVRFVPNSDNLIISTQTNVFLINRHSGEIVRELHASVDALNDIARSPDGEKIALAGMRRHGASHPAPLIMVDSKGSLLHRFGEVFNANSVAFSPDGRYLLAGTGYDVHHNTIPGQIHLFDVDSYELIRTYDLSASFANASILRIAFSGDGRWFIAADHDNIFIFDTASGAILQHIQHAGGELGGIAISPDNTQIAVGKIKIAHNTNHDSVFLWDVATGQLIRSFKSDWTWDVAFSPDGGKLAAACGENESLVKVWDVASGDELKSFNPEHTTSAFAVAFSPDGNWLLTGGNGAGEYYVKLWDYASGKLLRKFTHSYKVKGVSFTSNGEQILTRQLETGSYYSAGGIGRLWSLDTIPLRQPIVELFPGASQSGTVEQFAWADYVIETPAGANLLITATLQNTASLRLYGRLAEQPTLGFSDYQALETTAAGSYQLLIPNTQAGKYYIGVYGATVAGAQANFTIRAQFKDRHLADVTPRSAGNAGNVTLSISGLGFEDSGMQAGLYQYDTEMADGTITVQDSTAIAATFNLSGTNIGTYDLRLTWSDTETAELKSAFVISSGVGALLQSELSIPSAQRPNRQYVAQIRYQNVGDSDMSAPLYHLSTGSNAAIMCSANTYTGTAQVLGIPTTGDARIIPPGGSGQVPLKYTGLQEDIGFQLDVLFPTQTAINWADHKDAMRPLSISQTEWDSIFPTLTGQLGATWSSYLGVLGDNAQRLRERGDIAYCVSDHLDLEIRKAQGMSTAAIAGTLQEADSGKALGSVLVTAYTGNGSGGYNYYRDETNFANGHFTLKNLPTGVYTITAEGYYFSPTLTIAISGDQDVTDRDFLAYPVPDEVDEADPVVLTANHFPVLSVDDQGNAVMVWQRYGQLWTAEYSPTNQLWHHSGVVSGTLGEAPSLAYGATVADGNPGFTALWRSGSGNSGQLHYSIITRNGDGDLQWREPITLTNIITGTAGDTAPAIIVPDNGDPLALWLRRNWDIQDDTDLYYQQFNPPPLQKMRLLVIVPADELEEFSRSPLAEHCVGVSIKQGASLPSWVPLIGGKYGFEVSGSGCGEIDCDLSVSGSLEAGVDFSDRVSGSGSGNFSAAWSTGEKYPPCEYVFDSASLGLSAGAEGKVPAFAFSIPLIVSLEAGAVINGEVAGSVIWKGGNFPGYPTGGEVELTAGIGPYGTATFIKIIEAEIKGTGQVKAKYVAPSSFSFEGWCMNLNASAKAWILSYSFDKSWGPACSDRMSLVLRAAQNANPRQMMLSVNRSVQDDVPITEILTIQVVEQVGTGNIYTGTNLTGNPVLSATIAGDLTNDGNPAVARSGSGEILVAWTKDSADQNSNVGSSVVVANTNGVTFTLPLTIAGTDRFNKHVDAAFESDDTPMVVWSSADASGVSLSSTYTDVLDAIDAGDIYYSRRVSDTWSAPAAVATLSGTDENTRLAADGTGNATVAWTHRNGEENDKLYTAFWNGSAWSSEIEISKQAGVIESLDVVYTGATGKAPLLVWAQDTDGDPETLNDLAIFYSVYSATTWTAPTMLEQATALQEGEKETEGALHRAAVRNHLPTRSVCSAAISPPGSCCPPPEPPPEPPAPPAPVPAPQPVAPPNNDGSGGTGSNTIDSGTSTSVTSNDPNEKLGLAGWDGAGSVISNTRMVYTIFFENVITATAPAQEVFLTDQLSDRLDWTTLRFEEVAFGDTALAIEDDGASFQTQALVNDYRYPSTTTWRVDVSGQININTGELGWTFRTLDPATGLLPGDVGAGFLPPNDDTGRGEGHVTFSIEQMADLSKGTVITNQANIVFDTNEAILTNIFTNTVGQPIIYLPLVLRQ